MKENHINAIKQIKKNAMDYIKIYKDKYKRYRKIDNLITGFNTAMSSCSIALLISGFVHPILMIIGTSLSAMSFIITQLELKYNIKSKIESYKQSYNNYSELANEINIILNKNNMTSDEYYNYLQFVTDKFIMIGDSSLII